MSSTYAVISTGGRQVRVSPGDTLMVDRRDGEPGDSVVFDRVLLVGGDSLRVGSPTLEGATVKASVVRQMKDKKVLIFKTRRRSTFRRTNGHRQPMTLVKIDSIEA